MNRSPTAWDHLRVCGAVNHAAHQSGTVKGSSPRVRSGLRVAQRQRVGDGIISACAERSPPSSPASATSGDHLRVCGAVAHSRALSRMNSGSSPRVRSGQIQLRVMTREVRIISACAERSRRYSGCDNTHGDHLRVCGAVSCILLGFGPVGWCGMFDSYVVRGRGVALFSIFGMDAFDICYARQPATDMGSAGGRRLSEEL